MKHFPSPFGLAETRRLAALSALDLLDTPPEESFDAIARLTGVATGFPTVLITFVDRDRMWVKAAVGRSPGILPREVSLCDTVISQDSPLVLPDVAADLRFSGSPLIARGVRSYAGVPVRVADERGTQRPVGALCIIDEKPRELDDASLAALEDFARLTEVLIAARRTAREALEHATVLQRQQRLFSQAERMGKMGWWRFALDDDSIVWSDGTCRIHGVPAGTPPALHAALDFYPPHARATVSTALAHTIETGEPFDLEVDFRSARSEKLRIRTMGEVEWANDRPSAIIGVMRDITDEHALAQALRRSAETDALTGIANRAAFTRRLEAAVATARDDGSPLALVLIDLDGFKRINDTFGHPVGDGVLETVAKRLHAPWLAHCCAARLGGDEFALIVDDARLIDDRDALVARLESELHVATTIDGLTMETGASVGVMRFDPGIGTVRDFVKACDAALYASKRQRVGERRRA